VVQRAVGELRRLGTVCLTHGLTRTWIDRPAVAVLAEMQRGHRDDGADAVEHPRRPLPARELRRLLELARKRAATERAIAEAEARLAEARAVLGKLDKPLAHRRHQAEVEAARSVMGWLSGAIERDKAALAKPRDEAPAAGKRLHPATTAVSQGPELEATRTAVHRRLDVDEAARASEPVTPVVFERVGPRPYDPSAARLWDETAGRFAQHQTAWCRRRRNSLARRRRYSPPGS
jgi:hypothetical protein